MGHSMLSPMSLPLADQSNFLDENPSWKDDETSEFISNMHKTRSVRARGYQFPPEEMRIKDSEVLRSNTSKEWKDRRLVLTKDDLLEGLSGQEKIIEKIQLVRLKPFFPNLSYC